ncbi:MAG TPA: FKBP-type peptidyl-prolyl cis-trans isomerase [Sphingomicrobium sp.]|nr:FKBP-type peptidyl-prolyl cis-trans isomerase [Sphingomicrobium sp.]
MTRFLLTCAALALGACTTAQTPATAPASDETPAATLTGAAFLARNATASDVVTTASGLQYRIVKSGPATGPHPRPEDTVSFDYEGKLLNGETFDSSYTEGKPLSGQVSKFVPGFSEALQLMRPGDEWIVWIPPKLGYGEKEVGPIPPNSVLRFKLELHTVTPAS